MLHTLGSMATLGWAAGHARFHRDDVYMPITPMFHVHGWGVPYVATLMGVKQVYPGRYEPETLLELIEREKVTFSHCVPTILHMLLSHPKAAKIDLSGWKVIIGGAPMPQGLARQALDLGIDVFSGIRHVRDLPASDNLTTDVTRCSKAILTSRCGCVARPADRYRSSNFASSTRQ